MAGAWRSGDGLMRSADNGINPWAFTALGRGATALRLSASIAPGAHGEVYAALLTSPSLRAAGRRPARWRAQLMEA